MKINLVTEFDIMDHIELIDRAIKWLKNTFHCRIVLSESVAYTRSGETPDAIGWVYGKSILVECKNHLSDFYADQKKRSRFPGMPALGHWRFYLTPPNLIHHNKIPSGWGLYEVHGKKILHRGGSKYIKYEKSPFESCRDSEVAILLSALSKIQYQSLKG